MSETKPIKAVITDDSPQARKLLRLMLAELAPEIKVCGEAENVSEGLRLIKQVNPDVIFLDIEMPGKTGLQMAEELITLGVDCHVIFTTAYNAYAINAFRLSAIDYLLKPLQEDHLLQAIEKVKAFKNHKDTLHRLEALSKNLHSDKQVLNLPVQSGFEYVPIDEIEYFEADGSYVKIYCTNNRCKTISKNLKYFENALGCNTIFIRPHRSFLVNINFITSYSKSDGGHLQLKNNVQIPISRDRKQTVLEALKL